METATTAATTTAAERTSVQRNNDEHTDVMELDADLVNLLRGLDTTYQEALQLAEKDAPETEPYKFKYEAISKLQQVKDPLDERLSTCQDSNVKDELDGLGALLTTRIAVLKIATDEVSTGEGMLTQVVDTLRRLDQPKWSLLHMKALSQLGVVWADRSEYAKALEFLQAAEALHARASGCLRLATTESAEQESAEAETAEMSSPVTLQPYDRMMTGCGEVTDLAADVEDTLTHVLFFLAQCYGNLGQDEKSAAYCHQTLVRQLKSKTYDAKDWALNAATLAQYYLSKNDFKQTRHCLAAASSIGAAVPKEGEEQIQFHADIHRCWSKLFIVLLSTGRDIRTERIRRSDVQQGSGEQPVLFEIEDLEASEEAVPCEIPSTFEQARDLFKQGKQHVEQALEFYTVDDHAADYAELMQDMSQLYRCLIAFEDDIDRASKMHKRRVDILEKVLEQLNPQFYLLITRQMHYELAEVYTEMMELKLQRLAQQTSNGEKPTPQAVSKINRLIESGLRNFDKFIDCLRERDGNLPDRLDASVDHAYLNAHFWMARLCSKRISVEKDQQVKNLKDSEEHYRAFSDYMDKHKIDNMLQDELQIVKDMLEIIPNKIAIAMRA